MSDRPPVGTRPLRARRGSREGEVAEGGGTGEAAPGPGPTASWMTGRAVGCVLGVPDTAGFVKRFRDAWLPGVERRFPAPEVDGGAAADTMAGPLHPPERRVRAELAAHPARLHLDLLPEWQGLGYGRALVELDQLERDVVRRAGAEVVEALLLPPAAQGGEAVDDPGPHAAAGDREDLPPLPVRRVGNVDLLPPCPRRGRRRRSRSVPASAGRSRRTAVRGPRTARAAACRSRR